MPALLWVVGGVAGAGMGTEGNPRGCPAHSLGSQLSLEALHRCCLLHLHSLLNPVPLLSAPLASP